MRQAKDVRAPVDNKGYWVEREQFTGRKSFGYFVCLQCEHKDRKRKAKRKNYSWMSAHSFPQYMQGCKHCETKTLPTYMWVNTESPKQLQHDATSSEPSKPHDRSRCDACKVGKCLNVNKCVYTKLWTAHSSSLMPPQPLPPAGNSVDLNNSKRNSNSCICL